MAKEKRKSNEDELERRRIKRRQKYKQIKSNPEQYAVEKAKKKEAYLKRKSENKVKSINEMSIREQRAQRKRWRVNSKRYLEKKSKERKIQEITISQLADFGVKENTENAYVDPLNMKIFKKDIKNEVKKITFQSKIRALKIKHAMEKKKMAILIKKYQNRCRVLTRKINKMNLARTKIDSEYATIDQANLETSRNVKHKPILNFREKCLQDKFSKTIKRGRDSVHELIKDFYEDDINSFIDAGKKQYVKKYGVFKQKRYLIDTIKNLYKKFLQENSNILISYVTFSRLRPFWVFLPRDDRESCTCTAHTNMDLMIYALNKNEIVDIKNYKDLLDYLCCDKYNTKCVARECEICKNRAIPFKELNNLEEIELQEWHKDKKKVGSKVINIVKKKTRKIKSKDLIYKLEYSLPTFFSHTVNILNQYYTITQLQQSLKHDETLLHMNFSENYSYKFVEEVQSLHFGNRRGQVSLHTVIAYLKDGRDTVNHCLCSVSECTRHDAPAIWAHLQKALEFVFEKCSYITTVHILTNSKTNLYRNKHIFYIMTQLRDTFPTLKFVTWNFQRCGYTKSALDVIGANVKRTADRQVKYGVDVGDFPKFVEVVRKNIKNVEIRIVEEYEIIDKQIVLPKDISPFKGTMLAYQVIWKYNSIYLEFRKLSCFLCIDTICEHENRHIKLHEINKSAITSTIQNNNFVPIDMQYMQLNKIYKRVIYVRMQ